MPSASKSGALRRSGEEPVICIAEARRALSGALSSEDMDVADPASQLRQHAQQQQQRQQQAQLAQHAQHAHQAQHQGPPIGRTASAAELRSLAVGGAMRLTSGAQVSHSGTLLDAAFALNFAAVPLQRIR